MTFISDIYDRIYYIYYLYTYIISDINDSRQVYIFINVPILNKMIGLFSPENLQIPFHLLTYFDYFKTNILSFSITICPYDEHFTTSDFSFQCFLKKIGVKINFKLRTIVLPLLFYHKLFSESNQGAFVAYFWF